MTHSYPETSEKINIGRISYINVAPVYYGLDRDLKPDWLQMITEPPAVLNGMLERGDIVMSPISSAAYARNHSQWLLMPDVSISCHGKVMSVILASRYPIERLDGCRVVFTEESATAAALVRYFFSVHGVRPIIETRKISEAGDVSSGYDAALVIGDTALTQNWPGTFDHVFDLGEMWFNMTGLPFVFAVWAIRKDFVDASPEIVERLKGLFRESKNMGEKNMGEIVDQASLKTGLTKSLCHDYFNHLHCDLAPLYIKGLETFYKGLHDKKIIDEEVVIRFA